MAYFRNTAVNLVNLHYAIHAVALYGGGAFYFVFLLRAGVPVPLVLAALALILAGRFLIRPFIVPLAARVGLRPLLIVGTLFCALQFPLLAEVDGVGPTLLLFIAVSSLGDTFYWTTYHAYFAAVGDPEHRGHQLGVREAAVALVSIVSPLATGWALVTFGARTAFGVAAAFQVLAAVPLFWTPDIKVQARAPGAFKAALPGVALFAADGWTTVGSMVVWQLGLFRTLGEDFVDYGGALALAALVGAVGGLFLGKDIDAGGGRRAVGLALGGFALVILLRAATLDLPALAIVANALGALVLCLYAPTMMTAVYNMSKAAPCTLRFHVAAEGGWDAGGAVACLSAALLIHFGAPLEAAILLALGGVAASFVLLRRYYAIRTPAAGGRRDESTVL